MRPGYPRQDNSVVGISASVSSQDLPSRAVAVQPSLCLCRALNLGALLDLSQSRVSAVERGERNLISAMLIARISQTSSIPARLRGFYSDSASSLTSGSIAEVAEVRPQEVGNAHSVRAAATKSHYSTFQQRYDRLLPLA
ncbi:hypothetical protein GCM10027088_72110 [Nocardia goodfellowii]